MNAQELELLGNMNRALRDPQVKMRLDEIATRIEQKFSLSSERLTWEVVPLEVYGGQLPLEIRSSWVFLLREGAKSGAERHPNSHQRVRSWRGSGDFQVWSVHGWKSHFLQSHFDAPIEEQWASIGVNVWHQAVVPPGRHWIVVSFHTAGAEELIEETPDTRDATRMRQRVYSRVQS